MHKIQNISLYVTTADSSRLVLGDFLETMAKLPLWSIWRQKLLIYWREWTVGTILEYTQLHHTICKVSVPEDLFQAYNTRHSVQNRWCLSFTECTQFPHAHNFLTHPTSNFLTHPTCKYPCLTYQQNFLPRYWFFKGSPKRKTNLHHCKTLGTFGLFMFCSFFTSLAGY